VPTGGKVVEEEKFIVTEKHRETARRLSHELEEKFAQRVALLPNFLSSLLNKALAATKTNLSKMGSTSDTVIETDDEGVPHHLLLLVGLQKHLFAWLGNLLEAKMDPERGDDEPVSLFGDTRKKKERKTREEIADEKQLREDTRAMNERSGKLAWKIVEPHLEGLLSGILEILQIANSEIESNKLIKSTSRLTQSGESSFEHTLRHSLLGNVLFMLMSVRMLPTEYYLSVVKKFWGKIMEIVRCCDELTFFAQQEQDREKEERQHQALELEKKRKRE